MKKNFSKKFLALALISSVAFSNISANAIYGSIWNSPRIENSVIKIWTNDSNRKNVNISAIEVDYIDDETILKCGTIEKPLWNSLSSYPNFTSVSFYDENENRVEVNLNLWESIEAPLKIWANELRVHTQVQGYCLVEDLENWYTYNIDENTSEITLNFAKINFVKVETDEENTELELHKFIYNEKWELEIDDNWEFKTEIIKTINTWNSTDAIFKDLEDWKYKIVNKTASKEEIFTLDLENKNPSEPYQIISFFKKDSEKYEVILPKKIKLPDFYGDNILRYIFADLWLITINSEEVNTAAIKRVLIEEYLKNGFLEKNPNIAFDKITPYYFLWIFDLVFSDDSEKEFNFSEIFEFGKYINITKDFPEKIENNYSVFEFENLVDLNWTYAWLSSEDTCNINLKKEYSVSNVIVSNNKNSLHLLYNPDTKKYAINPTTYDYSKLWLNIDFSNANQADFDLNLEDINGKYLCIWAEDKLWFISTIAQSKYKINLDWTIDNSNISTPNIPKQNSWNNNWNSNQNTSYGSLPSKESLTIKDDPRVTVENFYKNEKSEENIENLNSAKENSEEKVEEKSQEKNISENKSELSEEEIIEKAKKRKAEIIKKHLEKKKKTEEKNISENKSKLSEEEIIERAKKRKAEIIKKHLENKKEKNF